ncbi:uncharacterized protein LOC110847504 [Folsomia candida]|uniref:Uncharacterized protein n=1 Tax=Folsomia candida TaxID=158441 RepID=A0A226EL04_FOLCA|nr:uncharacterized protein LOC110847504 [Folsomia candida]OXA57674.1 hypothetical protein Fcan01_08522 [Folsomia candida]
MLNHFALLITTTLTIFQVGQGTKLGANYSLASESAISLTNGTTNFTINQNSTTNKKPAMVQSTVDTNSSTITSSNGFGGDDDEINISSSEQKSQEQNFGDLDLAASNSNPSSSSFGKGGMRRGYGGTLRRPWGYSSHEWGLGRG